MFSGGLSLWNGFVPLSCLKCSGASGPGWASQGVCPRASHMGQEWTSRLWCHSWGVMMGKYAVGIWLFFAATHSKLLFFCRRTCLWELWWETGPAPPPDPSGSLGGWDALSQPLSGWRAGVPPALGSWCVFLRTSDSLEFLEMAVVACGSKDKSPWC